MPCDLLHWFRVHLVPNITASSWKCGHAFIKGNRFRKTRFPQTDIIDLPGPSPQPLKKYTPTWVHSDSRSVSVQYHFHLAPRRPAAQVTDAHKSQCRCSDSWISDRVHTRMTRVYLRYPPLWIHVGVSNIWQWRHVIEFFMTGSWELKLWSTQHHRTQFMEGGQRENGAVGM